MSGPVDMRDETIRRLRTCVRALEDEVRQLRDVLSPELHFPAEWNLYQRERQILAALYASKATHLSLERLFAIVYPPESECCNRSLWSHISKLRNKVGPRGITIETQRHGGYHLPPASRRIIAAALDGAVEIPRFIPRRAA